MRAHASRALSPRNRMRTRFVRMQVGKFSCIPLETGVLEFGRVTQDKRETTKGSECVYYLRASPPTPAHRLRTRSQRDFCRAPHGPVCRPSLTPRLCRPPPRRHVAGTRSRRASTDAPSSCMTNGSTTAPPSATSRTSRRSPSRECCAGEHMMGGACASRRPHTNAAAAAAQQ